MGPLTETVAWTGEREQCDLEFDPEELFDTVSAPSAGDSGDSGDTGRGTKWTGARTGTLRVTVEPTDLKATVRKAQSEGGTAAQAHAAKRHFFDLEIAATLFAPPSAPLRLRMISRSKVALLVLWEMPERWGGCALVGYEVQIREIAVDKSGAEETKDAVWREAARLTADKLSASIPSNIFRADVRVRAINCGCRTPSPWSALLKVYPEQSEQAEKAAKKEALLAAGGGIAAKRVIDAEFATEGAMTDESYAIVVDFGVDDMVGVKPGLKFESTSPRVMADESWSPFRTAIGEFFIAAGTHGGCKGSLFMLTAAQVEQYVTNDEDDIRDERLLDIKRPLLSFAVIACWSLQTYAHQASKPQKWIELVRDVSGLVDFAAETCQKGSVEDAEVPACIMHASCMHHARSAPSATIARPLLDHCSTIASSAAASRTPIQRPRGAPPFARP